MTVLARSGSAPDEAARWRERAFEAEREIARLRARVAELEAEAAARSPGEPPASPAPIASERERVGRRTEPEPGETSAPMLRDPAHQAEWDALVEGALAAEARRRLGRTLEPEVLDRLAARLREVRDAGLALEAERDAGEEPDPQQRLMRAVLLLETDRVFRKELGVGASEFLSGLDPGIVDDLGAEPSAGGDVEEIPIAEVP